MGKKILTESWLFKGLIKQTSARLVDKKGEKVQKVLEVKKVQPWLKNKNILILWNKFVYANKFENLGKLDNYLKNQNLKL